MARAHKPVRLAALTVAASVLVAPGFVAADDETPIVEVFTGYSYLTDQGEDAVDLPLGFSASLAWNPARKLGLVLDVDGHFNRRGGSLDLSEYGFFGGARYSWRGSRVTPFVEALVGAVRSSGTLHAVSPSGRPFDVSVGPTTDFAAQGGVGLDFHFTDRLSLRASADFREIVSEGESFHQFRSSVGLTFGFGGGSTSRMEASPPRNPPAPGPTFTPVETPPAPRPQPPPQERVPQERAPRVVTPEPAPRPAPAAPTATLPSDALGRGRELLRSGDLSRAADAFRQHLSRLPSRFTIAVGLFCDLSNVAQAARESGGDEMLMVLSVPRGGRVCYGLYWGLYDTRAAAQEATSSLPEGLRAGGQAVVPVSRLLR